MNQSRRRNRWVYTLTGVALAAWWLGLPNHSWLGPLTSTTQLTWSTRRTPGQVSRTELRSEEQRWRYGTLQGLSRTTVSFTAIDGGQRRPATPADLARLGMVLPRSGWSIAAGSLAAEVFFAVASWLATCAWWRALRRHRRPAVWTVRGAAVAFALVAWPTLVGSWYGLGLWQAAGHPLPDFALVSPRTMVTCTTLLLAAGTYVLCAASPRRDRRRIGAADLDRSRPAQAPA